MDVSDSQSYESLHLLRSTAFGELERSIEDNGESLIRRMRELEYLRSSGPRGSERGRSLHLPFFPAKSPTPPYQSLSDASGDEDDEIQIYAEESSSRFLSQPPICQSPDVAMDSDTDQHISSTSPTHHSFLPSLTEYVPSPFDGPGNYPADPHSSIPFRFPPTTQTTSRPIPQSAPARVTFGSGPFSNGSEIEALSLALASGAGGLNDYGPVHQGTFDDVNGCDAGDLWH